MYIHNAPPLTNIIRPLERDRLALAGFEHGIIDQSIVI